MERLRLKHQDAVKALSTFTEILGEPYSVIIRDASIQRFEYTFEAFWKYFKEYLKIKEGIMAASPKAVFRELLAIQFVTEEQAVALLEMTDRRNDTVHTYKEAVAKIIYEKLQGYCQLMRGVLNIGC
ncbi:MAG: nucleotidyltransferase substrate binding protein [Candidatus Omnitrophica bacterium]|nr:nucleotidyltransferase substrate binding protein [Candidatus Omnitrophota bacterium]